MYQQITIVGNVGRDPEIRYTASGTAVCSFSVAVNKTWTDRNTDEKREKTTWFRISAWRQLGETCSQYVHKGMLVMVTGEVEAQGYQGQDGEWRTSLELTARDVRFLSRSENSRDSAPQQQTPDKKKQPAGDRFAHLPPDEIPF